MNFNGVRKATEAGKYEEGIEYPKYRKDRTPEWRLEYKKEVRRVRGLFEADVRSAIIVHLGLSILDVQFEGIFRYAWDEGHSGGYCEVLIVAENLMQVVSPFVK